ncbi:hypothetical protein QOZ80_5AG0395280 [Eleusine coracana subsp. coracana]|nr:hypothetical protein QOZ80_5AG0395280 [Eleusine coracana subsp. coracana]
METKLKGKVAADNVGTPTTEVKVTAGKLMATSMKAAAAESERDGHGGMGHRGRTDTKANQGTMVLDDGGAEVAETDDDEEEVIDIDIVSTAEELKGRWLTVALFYSNQRVNPKNLFLDMSAAWGLRSLAIVRDIDRNKFLVELDSAKTFEYVTKGGPWRYKGEALIVVPYDGVSKATDLVINSIALWVRLFDLTEFMMNEDQAKHLGGKLGTVLEYRGAVRNFLQVRVDFPLAKPLKPWFKIRINGKISTVPIKYENVPNFCFICGTIGHAANDCQDEELASRLVRFGTDLRASPLKRATGTRFVTPVV